jgi:MprA protease rhombosortase-interaction domain-containing protein
VRLGRDRKHQQELQAELTRARDRSLAQVGPRLSDSDQLPTAEPTTATSQPASLPSSATQRDLDFVPAAPSGGGSGGGGGAFDPISGSIALAMAGLGFAAQRRKRASKRG